MTPYLTVPFALTNDSFDWLNNYLNPMVEEYQINATLASGLINFSNSQLQDIYSSTAWIEIVEYTTQLRLSNPRPQIFIYKRLQKPRPITLGNPHIDSYGNDGIGNIVAVRLNIMLRGEDSTEMVWWDKDRHDPDVVRTEFARPDKSVHGRLQARGNCLAEQWQILGEPDFRATHLARVQEHASFVRTDVLHALNWAGNQPRVIFSVKFDDHSWEHIEQLRLESH
jgi:hypothetical protein